MAGHYRVGGGLGSQAFADSGSCFIPSTFPGLFRGGHFAACFSDMDFNTTMGQLGKLCSIEDTVLYKVVDVTVPAN